MVIQNIYVMDAQTLLCEIQQSLFRPEPPEIQRVQLQTDLWVIRKK